jgi:glycine/D-amino acid oxidase-like deaminating enzyme
VLDDAGDWRGCGTAWHLAEQGHEVTIVCPHPSVGAWLARMASDRDLRRTLAAAGVRWYTDAALVAWSGEVAVARSLLDGTEQSITADSLVLATARTAHDGELRALDAAGIVDRTRRSAVGDVLAPRSASHAIY